MRVSAAFRACPKPIVAAVHGYALAGGFELALMCDVRFAARGTQFGLPDTPLGLSPTSGMTWLLPRVVGLGRAMYLTLAAESIDADEAERIGLVNRVTEPGDLLTRRRRSPIDSPPIRGSASRGPSSGSSTPSSATSRPRPAARRPPSSPASSRPTPASGSAPSSSASASRRSGGGPGAVRGRSVRARCSSRGHSAAGPSRHRQTSSVAAAGRARRS